MRLLFLKKLIFVLFALLIVALAYNQIAKGTYYFQLSQNNRIKLVRLPAGRGSIYDRNRNTLVGHRLVFNVALLAQEAKDVQQVFKTISPLVGIPQEVLFREFKRNFTAPFIPVVIASDISKESAIVLESRESDIPGLMVQTELLRDYRLGRSFCHILGYLGSASEEEIAINRKYGLGNRDLLGRGGVEKEFDRYLRGQTGGMQVEVNNRGYKVKILGMRQPRKGQDIHLTVDAQLQEFIYGLLEGKKGVCIVMDVENGEILSMVSKPDFDPNLFIAAANRKPEASGSMRKLLSSEEAVLINRAISGTYAPGSIFKLIVAAAGLETDEISARDNFNCAGSLRIGNREFFCWKLDGHGSQSLTKAIAHSCNVFFYKLGLKLGVEKLTLFARKFGLGAKTDVDLPFESSGLVPSKKWKLKTCRERWYDGETANFSIGQGYLLVTPLQIVQAISAIANGGYLVRPHIVKAIEKEPSGITRRKIGLRRQTLEVISEAMRQVVCDQHGTGYRANIPGVEWAAKTGTAQTAGNNSHGWFGAFYPFSHPRISVLVFLEHGGSGGEAPARIAREVIEYIEKNKLNFAGSWGDV